MRLSFQYRGVDASVYPGGLPGRRYERRVPLPVLASVAVPLPPRRFGHAVPASAPGYRLAAPQRPTPRIQPHTLPALLGLTSHPLPRVGVNPANTDMPARPWHLLLLSTYLSSKNIIETKENFSGVHGIKLPCVRGNSTTSTGSGQEATRTARRRATAGIVHGVAS